MKTGILLVASLLMTTAVLATPPPGKAKGRLPPAKTARPDVLAWHDRFDMPWEVVPAELSFKDEEMHAMLLRADAAARKIAKPNWKVKAGAAYPYLSWNSGSDGYNRTYLGKWESGRDTRHTVSLMTTLYNTSGVANGFRLGAMWEPPQGWKASLGCNPGGSSRSPDSRHQFNLALFHPTLTPKEKFGDPNPGLRLSPGGPQFSTRRRDGDFDVRFFVSSRDHTELGSQVKDIAHYWESPESFRDVAIEELERLESRARKLIASGAAGAVWTFGGPTGADPPMEVGPNPREPGNGISEKVRKSVLEEALRQIADRKQLVEKHYEEMHRAATSTFPPLIDVLAGDLK